MPGRNVVTTVVDTNALFREGLSKILRSANFDNVCSTPNLDNDMLSGLSVTEPQLLVIGVDDDVDRTQRQIKLFKERGENRVAAVIAQRFEQGSIAAFLRAGARACLTRNTTSEALIMALELITRGGVILPQEALPLFTDHAASASEVSEGQPFALAPARACDAFRSENVLRQDKDVFFAPTVKSGTSDAPHLSVQEKRILRYLIAGASNKVIARNVDIAEATVKVHVKAILRKVRLQNRTQAAVWALSNGEMIFGSSVAPEVDLEAPPPRVGHDAPDGAGRSRAENGLQYAEFHN